MHVGVDLAVALGVKVDNGKIAKYHCSTFVVQNECFVVFQDVICFVGSVGIGCFR